jgi:hypothetical protein
VPGSLSDHDRVGRVHSVHDTTQVDVDDALPVRQRQFARLAAYADAGVVHHHV